VASVGEWEEVAVSEELSPPLTESPNAGYRMINTNKSQTRQAQNSMQKGISRSKSLSNLTFGT
jgi:hypothetical protein